jgi:hypothetical protein
MFSCFKISCFKAYTFTISCNYETSTLPLFRIGNTEGRRVGKKKRKRKRRGKGDRKGRRMGGRAKMHEKK